MNVSSNKVKLQTFQVWNKSTSEVEHTLQNVYTAALSLDPHQYSYEPIPSRKNNRFSDIRHHIW